MIDADRADGPFKVLARQEVTPLILWHAGESTQGTGNPPRGSQPAALNKVLMQKEN